MRDVRNDALTGVMSILENRQPSHIVMANYLTNANDLSGEDKSFYKKLVQGVVERMITLDYIADCVSRTKTAKMKPVIRNIIRMGVYQIIYMNVPDSAACNESVKLAKRRGFETLGGFVNGVLRNIARQKEELTDFEKNISVAQKGVSGGSNSQIRLLSVKYSMPEWIVRYFTDKFGTEKSETVFEYFLTDNKTAIRCNISKITPSELERRLTGRGISVEKPEQKEQSLKIPEKCFLISDYASLSAIPEFTEGLFTVQDMSSVMSGEIAEIEAGMKVLDLCAAPGGKSLNIADRMIAAADAANTEKENKRTAEGIVTSCDVSEQKVRLIDENVRRCGFTNIKTEVNDATAFREDFEEAFDLVICDVPCSGLGIIGKKPDIKYNMTCEGQKELIELQRKILGNAVRYVKKGGQMIFSTCTVNRSENEENVDYIKTHGMKCVTSKQLLPGLEGTDGFFYAGFRRLL